MDKKAYFLKCLTNGNIIPITDNNRIYSHNIVKRSGKYVLLDEDEQIIGDLELSPSDAEIYVEQKLQDIIEREARLEIKEIEIEELKSELKAKIAEYETKEVVKVDKRKKELKEN